MNRRSAAAKCAAVDQFASVQSRPRDRAPPRGYFQLVDPRGRQSLDWNKGSRSA
jgi:hypothetical protein